MWNQSRCNGTSERVTSRTGSYKACPNEAVTSLLCLHKRSVWNCPCLIWCCLSVLNYSEMASKLLVCAFIPASLFNARGRWLWALRCASLAVAPIPPGVLSQWGRSGSRSPGLWSRCCRGTAEVTVLGSQIDLSAELETDTALSLPSPDRFSASSRGWEARAAVSSARSRNRHFNYSSSTNSKHPSSAWVIVLPLLNNEDTEVFEV